MVFDLFTDGGCWPNPGPGGWGFIARNSVTKEEMRMSGSDEETTNNRMELQAVIEGLGHLPEKSIVFLYSDSRYVVDGINDWRHKWKAKGWHKVMNLDLWMELDSLLNKRYVTGFWIRGHDGHPENEECDRMSMEACADATQSVQSLLHPK